LSVVFGLGLLGSFILLVVGRCMACLVPSESGAKGLAIGSIACMALAVALVGAFVVVLIADAGGRRGPQTAVLGVALLIAALLLALGAHILYLLFLRGVAAYLGNRELAGRVIAYLVASLIIPLVLFGLFVLLLRSR